VQYLLVKNAKTLPSQRADMLKCVIKRCRSFFPEIFKRASDLPELGFGS
jgi:hypothetical protein